MLDWFAEESQLQGFLRRRFPGKEVDDKQPEQQPKDPLRAVAKSGSMEEIKALESNTEQEQSRSGISRISRRRGRQ